MSLGRSADNRAGFTLIELLVVIAVIALLASILFPVFTSAKTSSYKATCASNLLQFGKAFRMYADEWQGRLPLPGGGDGSIPASAFWLHSRNAGESLQIGALWPYIRTQMQSGSKNNFWSCPMAVPVDKQFLQAGFSPGQNYIMNDYIRSGHAGQLSTYDPSYPGYFTGLIIDTIPRTSRVILLYEGVQDRFGFCARHSSIFYVNPAIVNPRFGHLQSANIAQDYHNGMSNFLFLDGHVQSLRPQDTWSEHTAKKYGSHRYFQQWTRVYPGWGTHDMWNPQVSNVIFP